MSICRTSPASWIARLTYTGRRTLAIVHWENGVVVSARSALYLHLMQTLADIRDEYEFLEPDDRYRLLIDLGRALEPMPAALKTEATLVRGCSASVWVYATQGAGGALHFLADSNAGITKGMVALVLASVQDRSPEMVRDLDIAGELAPFDLGRQLSSNRTQGLPNMIALIRETAARLAPQAAAARRSSAALSTS